MLRSLDVTIVSAQDLQGTPGRSLERPGCSGLHEVMLEMMPLILRSCMTSLYSTILSNTVGRCRRARLASHSFSTKNSMLYYSILY